MNDAKSKAFAALTALGATKVVESFSGGNDEGGYGSVTFYNGEQELDGEEFTGFDVYSEANGQRYNYDTRSFEDVPANEHREAIAKYLEGVLDGEYGGFAGDYEVYGNVTIDATERTVTMTADEKSDYVTQPVRTF